MSQEGCPNVRMLTHLDMQLPIALVLVMQKIPG
jgi:hypothetical protein